MDEEYRGTTTIIYNCEAKAYIIIVCCSYRVSSETRLDAFMYKYVSELSCNRFSYGFELI